MRNLEVAEKKYIFFLSCYFSFYTSSSPPSVLVDSWLGSPWRIFGLRTAGQPDRTLRICLVCQAWTIFTLEKGTVNVPCALFFFASRQQVSGVKTTLQRRRAKTMAMCAYLHTGSSNSPEPGGVKEARKGFLTRYEEPVPSSLLASLDTSVTAFLLRGDR